MMFGVAFYGLVSQTLNMCIDRCSNRPIEELARIRHLNAHLESGES